MHSKVALRARTERVSLKQLFQVRWDLTTTASDDHLISVTATPYSADLDASPMRGAHHSALVDSSDNETVIIRAQEGCRTGACLQNGAHPEVWLSPTGLAQHCADAFAQGCNNAR